MIVSSNAFVFSTSLLAVVSRYGLHIYLFPEHFLLLNVVRYTKDLLIVITFRYLINLEAVTFILIP